MTRVRRPTLPPVGARTGSAALLAAGMLVTWVIPALPAGTPGDSTSPAHAFDIVVGEEEILVDGESIGLTDDGIEIDGTVYPFPDVNDLPVEIEADEHGFRISIGDEEREAQERARQWSSRETPHRLSFGHDVDVAAGEIVEGGIWSIGGDVYIAGTVEGAVVVFAGDVLVEGEIDGDVVAVWGSVELDPSAICGGDVVAIGGTINQNSGHVEGEAFSLNLPPGRGIPGLESALLVCAVASIVLFGAFALTLSIIFRANTERMLVEIRARPFHAFWVGFALHALGPLVLFLLLVTLIGAPLAILGWLLWWAVAQSGVVIGAVRLGQAVLRRPEVREVLPAALVGGLVLHAPFLIGVLAYSRGGPGLQALGILMLTLASGLAGILTFLGSGALVATRFGEGGGGETPGAPNAPLFDPLPPSGRGF